VTALDEMNDRTCIVTRRQAAPDELIRFVLGPDGAVVADIRRKLPGRGCWVTAERRHVDAAARKGAFARAFRTQVAVPADLGGLVDGLLARSALGALGLARKAGAVALGATKVEAAVRGGAALLVLHALEAKDDGVRKIAQARRAAAAPEGPQTAAYKLFPEADLSLALGGTNVIHAAVLAGDAGRAVQKRMVALDRFRGGPSEDHQMLAAVRDEADAAEDME
jgi:predicted RNA-binding protein YlxR (DUF448 family)